MTLNDLKPFGDRLIVRPDAKIETTAGGLVVPDVVTADNPNYFTMTGTVLKLGDGIREDVYRCQNAQCRHQSRRTVGERCQVCGASLVLIQAEDVRPFDVAVGDRVVFNRFAGKQIKIASTDADGRLLPDWLVGDTLLIMREVEVLGVLDDDAVVLPGYEAPAWNAATSNKGDRRPGSRATA